MSALEQQINSAVAGNQCICLQHTEIGHCYVVMQTAECNSGFILFFSSDENIWGPFPQIRLFKCM
jgi:hypothetical protein